ncbi:MAG: phosphonate ABC transporter ATP-binding protein [Promicromonosporaceae bacterium]|nr:phosphonate ABC transporter ATP-binding protein [Promicromonosporaceae bacterium]
MTTVYAAPATIAEQIEELEAIANLGGVEPFAPAPTVLAVDNVSKRYPNGVQALKGVSFSVAQGEFVVVIGPSGSGKSTLLRSLNKLVEVSDGRIEIDGECISATSGRALQRLRRKVAMVFQHYNLVGRLSVLQNVLHGRLGYMNWLSGALGRYSEADKVAAIDLLHELDLGEFVYNRAGELSGGQKQRVGIARAVMQQPKVMLCDEPIASLDPSSAKVIMDMIRTMSEGRDITCVVNLHQIDVALKYATRIIGLHAGELVFDGPPSQLDAETIELIYNTPIEELMISEALGE